MLRIAARSLALAFSACSVSFAGPAMHESPERPVELGEVAWSRDFDATLAASKASGKPVLVLFDEVPGCHTCVSFGTDVLSNPLVVEAAQTLFHPVAVYNNIDGTDLSILKSFDEPTWNNPVVRVIDADKNMLAKRVNGDYTTLGITGAMIAALEKTKREVPGYLRLLNEEARMNAEPVAQATFAMHCFWEGQAQLASLEGVVGTKVGWLDGKEVVDVEYDPSRIKYSALLLKAQSMQCASTVFARTDGQCKLARELAGENAVRSDDPSKHVAKDELYRLVNSPFKHVPMTPLQAQKVNAALGMRQDPSAALSPAQVELAKAIEANPDAKWPTLAHAHNTRDAMGKAKGVLASID